MANAIEMTKSFIVREYPVDLIEHSMILARRQERASLLEPKDTPETEKSSFESMFLLTTYNPERNIPGNIVKNTPHTYKNSIV